MKNLKLNVLSSNCKLLACTNSYLVAEDFESLLKLSKTTKNKSIKNSPKNKPANFLNAPNSTYTNLSSQMQMNAFPKLKDFDQFKNIGGMGAS